VSAHSLTLLLLCAPVSVGAQEPDPARGELEAALRAYFGAEEADGPALQAAVRAAQGREELLEEVLRSKSFVASAGPLALHGRIDERYRFRAHEAGESDTDNDALFFGPGSEAGLQPLVVYVPDSTSTAPSVDELEKEVRAGRFVLLVPDEERDNQWKPTHHEHRRHAGPLRTLLLEHRIDPERVYFVGSGRGGHAAWTVGLLYAQRFAGIAPCNGGPACEGSYALSGGVFLENARSLVVHAVYNTSFDHGLEGCRYAARKFEEWGYRFTGIEEPAMRTMDLVEAMEKVADVTRDSHPRAIVKRFNHLDAGEHFWLRALERAPGEWDPAAKITLRGKLPTDPLQQREKLWEHVQGLCARLEGTLTAGRITIQAQGVGKLRVYFDPELVPYGKKVSVTINGKPEPPVVPKRDVATLLQHVHASGDTARLYGAFHDYRVR